MFFGENWKTFPPFWWVFQDVRICCIGLGERLCLYKYPLQIHPTRIECIGKGRNSTVYIYVCAVPKGIGPEMQPLGRNAEKKEDKWECTAQHRLDLRRFAQLQSGSLIAEYYMEQPFLFVCRQCTYHWKPVSSYTLVRYLSWKYANWV